MLGVGAQKAGTTWLYRYLEASPTFVAGYRKEYHVFDSVDVPSQRWVLARNAALARSALDNLEAGAAADADVIHRMSMCADPRYYFDYFTTLLARDPHRHLTADVTPAYALLPVERMRQIRSGFESRGVRPVAIFLMRDPVERIWSQIRMQHQRSPNSRTQTAEEAVLRLHDEEQYRSRSMYHHTIAALDAAFSAEDLYYGFYENLFTEESVERMCGVLGVGPHPADFDVRRNAAPATGTLPESTVRAVASHLAEVYERVAQRFPEVDLERLWPSIRYLP